MDIYKLLCIYIYIYMYIHVYMNRVQYPFFWCSPPLFYSTTSVLFFTADSRFVHCSSLSYFGAALRLFRPDPKRYIWRRLVCLVPTSGLQISHGLPIFPTHWQTLKMGQVKKRVPRGRIFDSWLTLYAHLCRLRMIICA